MQMLTRDVMKTPELSTIPFLQRSGVKYSTNVFSMDQAGSIIPFLQAADGFDIIVSCPGQAFDGVSGRTIP